MKLRSAMLVFAMLTAAVHAQQPAPSGTQAAPAEKSTVAAPTAPATVPPANAASPTSPAATAQAADAASSSDEPSADTIKKARAAGYRAEVTNGVALYCRKDSNTGTRFPTKKCVDGPGLAAVLDIHGEMKDTLQHAGACLGSCNGK